MFWYGTLWVMNSDDDHEVKAKKKAMMVATMAYFVILLCGWGLMKIMDITGAGGWSSAGDSYIRNVVTTSSSCIGDKTGNCAKNISVTPTGGSTSSSDASSSALQGLDGLTQ